MPEGPGPQAEIRTGAVRRPRMRFLPLVFGAFALAMVCGSIWSPWYSYNLRDGPNYAGVVKVSYSKLNLIGTQSYSAEYDRQSSTFWDDAAKDDNTARLFLYLRTLVIVGAVMAGGAVAGCVVALRKGKRGIATAFGLLLAAWCLFTPLFFMANLDPARQADSPYGDAVKSFWGQSDSADAEIGAPDNIHHRISTWGPDTGWFMSFTAAIFGALTVVALLVPGPRPRFTEVRLPVVAAVLVAVCLVGSAVALYPAPVHEEPPGRLGGLRVETVENGDWLINIVSGSIKPNAVSILITNSSTGGELLKAPVSSGTAANPDFFWNDSNLNNKVDAGDFIVLKGTINGAPNPKVQAGFKVQFLRDDSIIGTIKELPPH